MGMLDDAMKFVKANAAKLDGCETPHDFKKIMGLTPRESMKLANKCQKCGGQIANELARWYILGMTHAVGKKIEAEEILHLEDCPNPECENKGVCAVDDGHGGLEPEPCEWCWTHPKSKFRENGCHPL